MTKFDKKLNFPIGEKKLDKSLFLILQFCLRKVKEKKKVSKQTKDIL